MKRKTTTIKILLSGINIITLALILAVGATLSTVDKQDIRGVRATDPVAPSASETTKVKTLPSTARTINDPFARESSSYSHCDGSWVELKATGRVGLSYLNVLDWKPESNPSIINETKNTENIVIIGHNWCPYGNCFTAGSQFSKIMNSKIGDESQLCLNGKLYKGYVVMSEAIPENKIEVLGQWLGIPSVTLFTSYGNCKTSACLSTDQRWLVVFNRN